MLKSVSARHDYLCLSKRCKMFSLQEFRRLCPASDRKRQPLDYLLDYHNPSAYLPRFLPWSFVRLPHKGSPNTCMMKEWSTIPRLQPWPAQTTASIGFPSKAHAVSGQEESRVFTAQPWEIYWSSDYYKTWQYIKHETYRWESSWGWLEKLSQGNEAKSSVSFLNNNNKRLIYSIWVSDQTIKEFGKKEMKNVAWFYMHYLHVPCSRDWF